MRAIHIALQQCPFWRLSTLIQDIELMTIKRLRGTIAPLLIFLCLLFGSVFLSPAPTWAAPVTIDFESLPSGAVVGDRQIIPGNAYASRGVTFSLESPSFSDAVVGIVSNGSTSACVESKKKGDHVLGTGRAAFPNGSIGLAAFTIRAHFDPPINQLSANFQTILDAAVPMRLRIFSGKTELGDPTTAVGSPAGTCGFPGTQRTAGEISAAVPIGLTITDALFDVPGNGRVFAIDNLQFSQTSP
jgi:hypothetical protein